MSDAPVSKSPFWRFSIKFYAVPGVAQALFDEKVGFSKQNCPISKALNPSIAITATTAVK